MSDSGQLAVGRPDAMVEAAYLGFRYCGGSGGGGCIVPAGATGVVLEYRLSRNIVRNRRIIFENKEFFGVRMYTDAGATMFCSYSLGVEVPTYMALSIDGNLTGPEVQAIGRQLSGALPYEIEFVGDEIPQPYEGAWASHIFVHLYWGSAGYINQVSDIIGPLPTNNSFRVVKHDYDIKL